jgi:hypothetical protein
MALFPCSICGQRRPGKLASLYNAWFGDGQTRIAYKQRLCIECLTARFIDSFKRELGREVGDFSCIGCGGDATKDAEPIYVTLYLPKEEPREFALIYCSECHVAARADCSEGAEPLADRGASVRGPSPSLPNWGSALGI